MLLVPKEFLYDFMHCQIIIFSCYPITASLFSFFAISFPADFVTSHHKGLPSPSFYFEQR